MNTTPQRDGRGRLWRIRGAAAAGAVLLGGVALGVTGASADTTSPSPTPSASATAKAPAKAGDGTQAKHPFVRALREELRTDISGTPGFGDKAHELAYVLIHHTQAFNKLPANLQTDLKTLEAAAASERDSDATKIKDTALNGGYGDKIQKAAKAIQTKLSQPSATPSATPSAKP
ncbi:hypothetical protein SB659_10555 [Arthrobacter sp. SIMBA_036]|uniref:hypothetical protein n=2 Tax=Bacteria TaxID=2 RepID=UPI00397CB097